MLNEEKLKQMEAKFLAHYPGGFNGAQMEEIGKRHRMDKMVKMSRECFSTKTCTNVRVTAENMIKVVSRSSMVSMFEKPKFRDFIHRLDEQECAFLVDALMELLHGSGQTGFEAMVDLLKTEKLAKWSLVTIIPAYYWPQKEGFIKPTTAKDVIRHFKLEDLEYKPGPTWHFYRQYRKLINESKGKVDKSLSPSNAAFSGFLMMGVKL
jgi:hypothetical protein